MGGNSLSEPLHVGVLGISDEAGTSTLEAVSESPVAELVAVADRDGDAASRVGTRLGAECFDDFRAFVHAPGIDALLIAAPPFACTEALRLAASKRIPVWRTAAPARNFSETVQLANWFAEAQTPLVVSRSWACGSARLSPDALADHLGEAFLAHAEVIRHRNDDLDWRGDRERAGGGVVLDQAYDPIDLAVSQMGVPDVVAAATARVPRPPETKSRHDTEDTAIILMRYASGAMASMTTCWLASPSTWRVSVHGERGSLALDETRLTYWGRDGRELSAIDLDVDDRIGLSASDFLQMIAAGETKFPSTVSSHLPTMAVIEAAYLSARTGEPESPLRQFDLQGVSPPPRNESK